MITYFINTSGLQERKYNSLPSRPMTCPGFFKGTITEIAEHQGVSLSVCLLVGEDLYVIITQSFFTRYEIFDDRFPRRSSSSSQTRSVYVRQTIIELTCGRSK